MLTISWRSSRMLINDTLHDALPTQFSIPSSVILSLKQKQIKLWVMATGNSSAVGTSTQLDEWYCLFYNTKLPTHFNFKVVHIILTTDSPEHGAVVVTKDISAIWHVAVVQCQVRDLFIQAAEDLKVIHCVVSKVWEAEHQILNLITDISNSRFIIEQIYI